MPFSRKDVDKTCAMMEAWARWIVSQDHPPLIYAAFQRTRSSNLPRPLLGVVFQDDAGIERWTIGSQTHRFADHHAVILSCAQGSQSAPPTQPGGLWISTFDLAQHPEAQSLLTDYAFRPFAIRNISRLRDAYQAIIAARLHGQSLPAGTSRVSATPHTLHLKAAWLKLLAHLQDELTHQPARDPGHIPPAIEQAVLWLNQHYHNPHITQLTLAGIACLDPHHFGRSFKHAMGVTPMHYLRQLRLGQAAYLLETTRRDIATIARDVGLSDPQHFARLFKRAYQQSPTDYRHMPGQ